MRDGLGQLPHTSSTPNRSLVRTEEEIAEAFDRGM